MLAKILLTGGSSFTGVWIAEAFAAAGFEVVAPLLRRREEYVGVRLERVERLERCAAVMFERAFGSSGLLEDIRSTRPDVLVHHAAQIAGYRDPGFDPLYALGRNTAGASAVLQAVRQGGGRLVVLTSSVFEAGEGKGDQRGAVTPYGLSKTLTSVAFDYWTRENGLAFARFVIPSPYGVLEERRFSWHLFRSWFAGETPLVRTPLYLRDHLPVPQLARAYSDYVAESFVGGAAIAPARPSGWIARQGDFALRVAAEASARLGRSCPVELGKQIAFEEPEVRVNDQTGRGAGWCEATFWDSYVAWYAALNERGELN